MGDLARVALFDGDLPQAIGQGPVDGRAGQGDDETVRDSWWSQGRSCFCGSAFTGTDPTWRYPEKGDNQSNGCGGNHVALFTVGSRGVAGQGGLPCVSGYVRQSLPPVAAALLEET